MGNAEKLATSGTQDEDKFEQHESHKKTNVSLKYINVPFSWCAHYKLFENV